MIHRFLGMAARLLASNFLGGGVCTLGRRRRLGRRTAEVDGLKIHYLISSKGPAVLLCTATGMAFSLRRATGHWLMEERPKETMDAIVNFL